MILIIDDDKAIRSSLNFMLKRTGYEVATAATPGEAMLIAKEKTPELVLMDMNYSLSTTGAEGLKLLQEMKALHPQTPVILITAWGSIDIAVQGMKLGAFDFITKPWDNRQLMQQIETALELSSTPASTQTTRTNTANSNSDSFDRSFIIGQSQAITSVLQTIERVAQTNASVLITGESGTGKELIAEAIHRNSQRAQQSFVKVNLGGISQSLFESEMFGHKKGAFTDASSDRTGRFTLADKGTIFLDEIGELDLSCQVKLLRVLQDQTYEVLGDSKQRKIDVRVVCATNEDLPEMIKQKTFREDLYYRINLIQVHLPALRERREDIPLLIKHFAQRQQEEHGMPKVNFTEEAMTRLCALPYPGNIRELKNLIDRLIIMSNGTVIDGKVLDEFGISKNYSPAEGTTESKDTESLQVDDMTLQEVESQAICQQLVKHNGNLTLVARTLGITRQALYRRIEKYNIDITVKKGPTAQ